MTTASWMQSDETSYSFQHIIWWSYIPVLFTSKKKTNKNVSIHGKSLTAHSKAFSKNSWGWNPFFNGHRDDVAQVFNTWLLMEAPMVFQWEGCLFLGHAPNKKKCLGPGTSVDISGYGYTFGPWGWIKIIRFHAMFEGFRHPKAPEMAKKLESAEVRYEFGPTWLPWQTSELSILGVQFHVFFWGADCTYIYNYI